MTDSIVCSAGCKRQARDDDAALALGWEVLPISTRWRCLDCTRELRHASSLAGSSSADAARDALQVSAPRAAA
jgi:hypothetical protein